MILNFRNKRTGNLFILSGPSGVGKTTLRETLQKKNPALRFSISWTTRPPRAEEESGRDYLFVSHGAFQKKRQEGGFLEWAKVHNEFYGTPRGPVLGWINKGEDVLLDIDIQGARKVKKKLPQSVTIFILPPSRGELKRRLVRRETESSAKIRLRLKNAEEELQAVKDFEYAVINREISASVEALEFIIKAARFRVGTLPGNKIRLAQSLKPVKFPGASRPSDDGSTPPGISMSRLKRT